MPPPLVSVCIGAYNRKDTIRECVDSALGQTWPNKEVVVVDDASTDGTREILEEYGNRIRLIWRETNSGICPVTRNQAAEASNGEYVAFLDSDDVWYPEKLQKQVAFLESHPDVPLCHTLCHVLDGASRVVGVRHGAGVVPSTGWIFDRLLDHCWITISTVMVTGACSRKSDASTKANPTGIWAKTTSSSSGSPRNIPSAWSKKSSPDSARPAKASPPTTGRPTPNPSPCSGPS